MKMKTIMTAPKFLTNDKTTNVRNPLGPRNNSNCLIGYLFLALATFNGIHFGLHELSILTGEHEGRFFNGVELQSDESDLRVTTSRTFTVKTMDHLLCFITDD